MNRSIISTLLLVCYWSAAVFAQEPDAAPATTGKSAAANQGQGTPEESADDEASTIEKASFVMGFNFISQFKQREADYVFEKMLAGINAANDGLEAGMSQEEMRSVIMAYQTIIRKKAAAKREQESEANEAEGKKALEEFAKREGAMEIEDGVMYVVLKAGDGPIPEAPDRVKLHYEGKYVNGEVFDSSLQRDEPIINGVTQFVPGFSAALMKMPVGSKWSVIIRGDKAYGQRPRPPMQVNKTLMFEIELLSIEPIE
jgi:FKBP-type peptidyl-prolyl cis-trans isomerase FklB